MCMGGDRSSVLGKLSALSGLLLYAVCLSSFDAPKSFPC